MAGLPDFSGSLEHAMVIWDQIQFVKKNTKVLHVVWLDLENVYGLVPHHIISFALGFFHVPVSPRANMGM